VVPLIAGLCRDGKLPRVYPGHDVGHYGEPEEGLRNHSEHLPYWTGYSAGCTVGRHREQRQYQRMPIAAFPDERRRPFRRGECSTQ
jgi:hypothetical protein